MYNQLYLQLLYLLIGYRKGLKKYRDIEIKTVEAKFVKTYKSAEYWRTDSRGEPEYRDIYVDLYEYELNGKKRKFGHENNGPVKDTITLFYRKGKIDITNDNTKLNGYPMREALWRTFLIMPGSAIIVFLFLNYILKIPIDF